MKLTKAIFTVTALVLVLPLLSCKKNNADDSALAQTEASNEKAPEIPKEPPELFNMITVEGGWFTMGLSEDDYSKKHRDSSDYNYQREHKAYVSDFMMSSSEITQDKYEEIMAANPSLHASKYRPVELEKITDALAFCNKLSLSENLTPCYSVKGETDPDLWDTFWGKEDEYKEYYFFMRELSCDFNADGYRLPTESEWMYAARSGKYHEDFTYSGSEKSQEVAVTPYKNEDEEYINFDSPDEVKSLKPNKLGFYDMSGNLSELVWDYYAIYPEYSTVNYTGPERRDQTNADSGVLKGGNYQDRYTLEDRQPKSLRGNREFGIRVCRTLNSENSQKRTQKAIEVAKKDQLEKLKETVYSKLVKIEPFTYQNGDYKQKEFDGLYITKQPLTQDDVFLISDKYRGDCNHLDREIKNYNAIRFLNELSKLLGYEPYYIITMRDENGEYVEVDEDYLVSRNLDFTVSENDYDKREHSEFDKMKILCNLQADGFRLTKYIDLDYDRRDEEVKEEDALTLITSIDYNSKDDDVVFYLTNGLPGDMYLNYFKEADGVLSERPYYDFYFNGFYICKNIPEDKKEIEQIEKEIAEYSEKVRIKKLEKFEKLAGNSINDLMKNVKGGKALQSLDTENKNFLEVTLGTFMMSEIPVTNRIYSALKGEEYVVKDSQGWEIRDEEEVEAAKNSPKDFNWYQAAAFCNALSELYKLEKAYSFGENTVSVDYTANGFRMPTEVEWEHAARSGTCNKTLKYGVTIDSVVYMQNPNMFRLIEDDWEDYYKSIVPISVYTGQPNSLGIYNLAGLCEEWCNDFQYFDYYDFTSEKTGYTVSSYDSKPYYITKMPFGQVYAPQIIKKGNWYYYASADNVKLSVRDTSKPGSNDKTTLRLVRTANPGEMKKLLEEHEKEHLEMLAAQKNFFDENMKMASVKGQTFKSVDYYGKIDEKKTESVTDFEIADTEITNEMYIRVMHYNPNIEKIGQRHYNDSPNAPVTNISFTEAMYFCNELSLMYGLKPFYNIEKQTVNKDSDGFRLPLEQEWLIAAMEGDPKNLSKFSGSDDKNEVGVFTGSKPQEVKTKKPNKLGLYDMSGNVFEMVHYVDGWREFYSGYDRIKGGSYDYEDDIFNMRSWKEDQTGFRVVRGKLQAE